MVLCQLSGAVTVLDDARRAGLVKYLNWLEDLIGESEEEKGGNCRKRLDNSVY